MIELYTYGSTNGHKVAIALEELNLPYKTRTINVFAGEGRTPEFLRLNPTGKIPVLVDRDNDLVLTESNAILIYLADRAEALMPQAAPLRTRALELLFLQASLQGPMFGQRMHFSVFASETDPHGIRRYEEQGQIVEELCEQLLTHKDYFLGSDFSIVDIAFFAWYHAAQSAGFPIDTYPLLSAWYHRVQSRPAVMRGVCIPAPLPPLPPRKHIEEAPPTR